MDRANVGHAVGEADSGGDVNADDVLAELVGALPDEEAAIRVVVPLVLPDHLDPEIVQYLVHYITMAALTGRGWSSAIDRS